MAGAVSSALANAPMDPTKAPSLAKASARLGLSATPTDPLSAAGLPGVNPDVAKMAPFSSGRTTETADRASKELASAAAIRKAFGDVDLSGRAALATVAPGSGAAAVLQADPAKVVGLTNEAKAALTAALAAPKDAAALAAFQRAIGSATANPTDYAVQGSAATGAATAASTPDQLVLTSEVRNQLGISDADLQLVGIDPSAASTLSLGQLREAVSRSIIGNGPNGVRSLSAAASDEALGANARSDAAGAAHGLAAAGGLRAEKSTSLAAQAIEDAQDVVTLGGKDYTIESLLEDSSIDAIVRQYLDSTPDSQIRKDLQALSPELAKYIDDNSAALTAAVASSGETAKGLVDLRATNSTVGGALRAAGLTEEQVAKYFPSIADTYAADSAGAETGLAKAVLEPGRYGTTPDAIRALAIAMDQNPAVAAQIMALSVEDLQRSGLLSNPTLVTKTLDVGARIAGASGQQIAYHLFGTFDPAALMGKLGMAKLLGDTKTIGLLGPLIDANGDGYPDSEFSKRLQTLAAGSATTIADLIAGKRPLDLETYKADVQVAPNDTFGQALSKLTGTAWSPAGAGELVASIASTPKELLPRTLDVLRTLEGKYANDRSKLEPVRAAIARLQVRQMDELATAITQVAAGPIPLLQDAHAISQIGAGALADNGGKFVIDIEAIDATGVGALQRAVGTVQASLSKGQISHEVAAKLIAVFLGAIHRFEANRPGSPALAAQVDEATKMADAEKKKRDKTEDVLKTWAVESVVTGAPGLATVDAATGGGGGETLRKGRDTLLGRG